MESAAAAVAGSKQLRRNLSIDIIDRVCRECLQKKYLFPLALIPRSRFAPQCSSCVMASCLLARKPFLVISIFEEETNRNLSCFLDFKFMSGLMVLPLHEPTD
jgi:hypothetical protein